MSVIFSPVGATANVAAGTSSASVALTGFTGIAGSVVRVLNDASVTMFVAFGASTVTATTTASVPVRSGAEAFFEVSPNTTHAAAIGTGTPTGNIYFTSGQARC